MKICLLHWSVLHVVLAGLAASGCTQSTTAGADTGTGAVDTGIARDASGDGGSARIPTNHRAAAAGCSHDRGPGTAVAMTPPRECSADADCTAGMNGRCLVTTVAARTNYCSYDTCFSDGECGAAEVCRCRESPSDANVCSTGNCVVDADCGASGYCSPSRAFDRINFGVVGYFCHTPADSCVDDADCASVSASAKCTWFPADSHWACSDRGFFPP